jgi:hypothetical protein
MQSVFCPALDGANLSTKSTSMSILASLLPFLICMVSVRIYIERYKQCKVSADVIAAQNELIEELKKSREESRREREFNSDGGEDLLFENPNHPKSSESDAEDSEEGSEKQEEEFIGQSP